MFYYKRVHPDNLKTRVEPDARIKYIHFFKIDEAISACEFLEKVLEETGKIEKAHRITDALGAIGWLTEGGYLERCTDR